MLSGRIPLDQFKRLPLSTIEQTQNCLWIGQAVKLSHKGDWPAAFFFSMVVPVIPSDRDAVVAGETLLVAGRDQCLALPEQELLQVNLAGAELLLVCKMNIGNFYRPPLLLLCYASAILLCGGMQMQVVVLGGTLTEAEQDAYVRQATKVYPVSIIKKLFLNVQGDHVAVSYDLHRFRNLRKMGGYCIGEPSTWNPAKQAELRDTIPNPIDF